MLNTDNKAYHLVRLLRPRQWLKNTFVFAAAIFSGQIFQYDVWSRGVLAFVYFSMLSSSIYLVNDCVDVNKDRLHPIKKNRPIASNKISVNFALFSAFSLASLTMVFSYLTIGTYFTVILVAYLILQIAYIFWLKNVIIVDALVITFGFILRVYAGALAVPLSVSSWLILAVLGIAMLLAFGKRRAERTLLSGYDIPESKTRSILKFYPDTLLDSMISMSSSFAIISYSLFSFQVSPEKKLGLLDIFLPSTLIGAKWLMLTIPVVVYGVGRYLFVIYEKGKGESPERILLNDRPLLLTAILWSLMVLLIML